MKLQFTKMHGAGNDFVLIDDRELVVPYEDYQLMAAIAARRTGIGCEGIILLQPSDRADFRMCFLNPDGTEVELCGNGARCVASFAKRLGIANSSMTIETNSGLVDAEVTENGDVNLWMPDPSKRQYNLTITAGDRKFFGHYITIGCPHFVVPLDSEELESFDVNYYGELIRQHEFFSPGGTNVDFVAYSKPNGIRMRTYERGVEAESGACGTGAIASAVIGVECEKIMLPAKVSTSSGFQLGVDGAYRNGKTTGLILTGHATFVYDGVIDLDAVSTEISME